MKGSGLISDGWGGNYRLAFSRKFEYSHMSTSIRSNCLGVLLTTTFEIEPVWALNHTAPLRNVAFSYMWQSIKPSQIITQTVGDRIGWSKRVETDALRGLL